MTDPDLQTKLQHFLKQHSEWKMKSQPEMLYREYTLHDFGAAVNAIQKIAEVAETMDHHPDLHLTGYKHLKVELSTHQIKRISLKDIALAGRIDELITTNKR